MDEMKILDFDQSAKEQCIENAIALSRRSIRRDKSYFAVLKTQIGIISRLGWVAHLLIIFCASMVLYHCIGLRRSWLVSLFLVLLGPILQLAAIPEMMVSYRYKVWQMEQCTVITLAQVILIRISIWQTLNFLYIAGLTMILCSFIETADLIVYIFIPYNLSNVIAFEILRHIRKSAASVLCIVVDFVFVLVYYVGLQRQWDEILRMNLTVSWGISAAAFVFSIVALYRNIACKRGIRYGFIN